MCSIYMSMVSKCYLQSTYEYVKDNGQVKSPYVIRARQFVRLSYTPGSLSEMQVQHAFSDLSRKPGDCLCMSNSHRAC